MWFRLPTTYYLRPTTDYRLPTTDYRLPVRHYLGDVPCLAKNNEGSMLVERSMLTMRIERSICPLTRWMFATILVRRRLWSFLERLNLSQFWTLPNDFRMISYFRDEAEKVTTDPHDYPASVDGQGSSRQRFVEKAVNRSLFTRARIDFHDYWACGRHPSGLWPS